MVPPVSNQLCLQHEDGGPRRAASDETWRSSVTRVWKGRGAGAARRGEIGWGHGDQARVGDGAMMIADRVLQCGNAIVPRWCR